MRHQRVLARGRGAMGRLMRHEGALAVSLLRWVARRPAHGVGPGDTAVGYASAQAVTMWVAVFASVVETVVLALLVPWPLVHLLALVVGLWSVFFALGHHAACTVRPHVVGADGSLRVRYGALLDVRVPAECIAAVRLERRFPEGGLLRLGEDGTVDIAVAGQTTVTVELSGPVMFRRPLGRAARASRALRFHADDARAVATALERAVRGRKAAVSGEWEPVRRKGIRCGDT
ncbi:hypothetical protein JJV70_19295 [Streptomyces sp. JJ66]|uniref:hypothetical protein n=1 Tax=Streptomyces sp. JJ66 TaxID=2803843 RepID=UPI001C55FDD4|nr:hypothetical protein [Streptomyces sp. JJ66]MBW1604206.1 hypothetical protein [Streptomyces sp. JJ66]